MALNGIAVLFNAPQLTSSVHSNSFLQHIPTIATSAYTKLTSIISNKMGSFSVPESPVPARPAKSAATAKKPSPRTHNADTSIGKRKERANSDESGAKKKKRTSLDGRSSGKKAIDSSPSSTPQTHSKHSHETAPPNGRPTKHEPTFAPNRRSEPPQHPPLNACGHTIHPVYSENYAKAMCPMCLVDASMKTLQHIQEFINAHDGLSQWKENLEGHYAKSTYHVASLGGKKGKNVNGTDVSYRHCKRNLVNLINEIEDLSEMELAWEAKQPPENNDVYMQHVRLRKQYSATAALHWYKDTEHNGFIGRVEEDCEFFSQRRGRRWTIASDPDFPDRDGHEQDLGWKSLKKIQHKLLNDSDIPKVQRTDVAEQLPRRKRRREGASVSWNEDVYVRTEADVDMLRKASCSLSEEFLEPSPKRPRMGVLRTTPLEVTRELIPAAPVANGSNPIRPHYVIPLSRNGPPRDVTRSSMCRHRRRYVKGQWAVPEGSEIIDTSGYRKNFDVHVANMEQLQIEAAKMDREDLGGDTEMRDAPAADAQRSTPQPSRWSPSLGGRLVNCIANLGVFHFPGFDRQDRGGGETSAPQNNARHASLLA
ncbi:hypothetical protein J4E85_008823 [Alternaria conjuncta]|uniref:uncharacterized protein n=1 Tax=Alternaria conjuncta TaxID=181017 RepID=UPI00221FCF14|nr:uncharacterized protein J4E85_008823 [Alternaria conjuncta]KAI4921478.1 hypothetical protein J4E85_008823 [Alternaria conjuncta]